MCVGLHLDRYAIDRSGKNKALCADDTVVSATLRTLCDPEAWLLTGPRCSTLEDPGARIPACPGGHVLTPGALSYDRESCPCWARTARSPPPIPRKRLPISRRHRLPSRKRVLKLLRRRARRRKKTPDRSLRSQMTRSSPPLYIQLPVQTPGPWRVNDTVYWLLTPVVWGPVARRNELRDRDSSTTNG